MNSLASSDARISFALAIVWVLAGILGCSASGEHGASCEVIRPSDVTDVTRPVPVWSLLPSGNEHPAKQAVRQISHVLIVRIDWTDNGPEALLERAVMGASAKSPRLPSLITVYPGDTPAYHELPLGYYDEHRYLLVLSSKNATMESIKSTEIISMVDLDESDEDAALRLAASGESPQELPEGFSRREALELISAAPGEDAVKAFQKKLSTAIAAGEMTREKVLYLMGRPMLYSKTEDNKWSALYYIVSPHTKGYSSLNPMGIWMPSIKITGTGAKVEAAEVVGTIIGPDEDGESMVPYAR